TGSGSWKIIFGTGTKLTVQKRESK
uniref:Uncharacterized protein n=1 Tax=Poecilia mexicana TaxID=48701 RepID=A0A3B3YGU9_9TELE